VVTLGDSLESSVAKMESSGVRRGLPPHLDVVGYGGAHILDLAFTFDAVEVAVPFAGDLGSVSDQEAGVAGKFVVCLGHYLDKEFLRDELSARNNSIVQCIGFVEFSDHTFGVRCVGGLQRFKGVVLGFFDIGAYFVVIGCHCGDSPS
jgi:hypothetical protein